MVSKKFANKSLKAITADSLYLQSEDKITELYFSRYFPP